jgi:hypothetical protein
VACWTGIGRSLAISWRFWAVAVRKELAPNPFWTAKVKPVEFQDALEMCEHEVAPENACQVLALR